jgi:hypothetical protein
LSTYPKMSQFVVHIIIAIILLWNNSIMCTSHKKRNRVRIINWSFINVLAFVNISLTTKYLKSNCLHKSPVWSNLSRNRLIIIAIILLWNNSIMCTSHKKRNRVRIMVFNATFNNISVISWRSVLLVEEIAVPGGNHSRVTSHWQIWQIASQLITNTYRITAVMRQTLSLGQAMILMVMYVYTFKPTNWRYYFYQ